MEMETVTRALYAAAAALVLIGLGVRLAPTSAAAVRPLAADAIPRTTVAPAEPSAQTLRSAQEIVAMNVFAQSRTPPKVRYTPPELARKEAAPVRRRVRAPAPPPFHVVGTVMGPLGATALIEADPKVPGAEVYRVGDRVGGGRLAAISDSTIVLDGPKGRQVFRLHADKRAEERAAERSRSPTSGGAATRSDSAAPSRDTAAARDSSARPDSGAKRDSSAKRDSAADQGGGVRAKPNERNP
jgi:hypothetical protein